MAYKIKIIENWSGKTEFFQDFDNKVVGLYINEKDKTSKKELLKFLKAEINARRLEVCMD